MMHNNTINRVKTFAVITAVISLIAACGPGKKVSYLTQNRVRADLSLPSDREFTLSDSIRHIHRDTLTVHDLDGREVIIMNAVKNENGEMVAHDVIDAAVVTARFRNVAERHGKVDLQFNITVPQSMRSSNWQLRFYPDLFVMEDSLRLEPVIITGEGYRKAQLKGYQQYDRFLASIVQDTTRFINLRQLEIFIERNIPALYAFKNDSTEVSDEYFRSIFGVSEQEAIEHYTDKIARRINHWRKSRTGQMYERYVKVPIVTEGIRLDTVMRSQTGDFIYCYTQTIATKPKLRKADVVLSGEIFESSRRIYTVPKSEPLTFYISSISAFADNTERYMTKIIERRVEANTACYIDFRQGSAEIIEGLGNNCEEIGRIRSNLRDLVLNEKFDLDSITVSAFASPEGSVKFNDKLCLRRAQSASDYFSRFVKSVRDSIRSERGFMIDLSGGEHAKSVSGDGSSAIRFIARCGGENWTMLQQAVRNASCLGDDDREEVLGICTGEGDRDEMERILSRTACYKYIRDSIYPGLRLVRFDFCLHRKGMVKDTVHTTVLDENYMAGVQAIRDREYEKAISILRPYNDYNAAVAFTAMDYNASAMAILKDLPSTGQTEYLKAILHSRMGDIREAVQCFLNATAFDRSYFNRGNLDPEIRELITTYNLDRRDGDDM